MSYPSYRCFLSRGPHPDDWHPVADLAFPHGDACAVASTSDKVWFIGGQIFPTTEEETYGGLFKSFGGSEGIC